MRAIHRLEHSLHTYSSNETKMQIVQTLSSQSADEEVFLDRNCEQLYLLPFQNSTREFESPQLFYNISFNQNCYCVWTVADRYDTVNSILINIERVPFGHQNFRQRIL